MKQEEFFNRIKALVERERYDEARELLLKAGDHPRVQVWLGELDRLELAKASREPGRRQLNRIIALVFIIAALVGGLYLYAEIVVQGG